MKRNTSKTNRGFTLIEMLIVIGIIVLLMGLTLSAVQMVRQSATRAKTATEITQGSLGAASFSGVYGVYPQLSGGGPAGEFRLATKYTDAAGLTLTETVIVSGKSITRQWPEIAFLKQCFPRCDLNDNGLRRDAVAGSAATIPNTSPDLLDGNQALVFWLSAGTYCNGQGFSSDSAMPFTPPIPSMGAVASSRRKFMDFPISRLIDTATGINDNRWRDPFGTPYAVLGYDRSINNYPAVTCFGVSPYVQSGRLLNSGSVQLISAGPDLRFGPGGNWTPGVGAWANSSAGADDISNFSQAPLGSQ